MMGGKHRRLLLLPYALIVLMPLFFFMVDALWEVTLSIIAFGLPRPEIREIVLLIKSFGYSVMVTALTITLSFCMALAITGSPRGLKRYFLFLLLLFIPLPLAVHTKLWMDLVATLNQRFNLSLPIVGWGISVLVQSLAFVPISTAILCDAMAKIPSNLVEAGSLLGSNFKTFFKIWIPQSKNGVQTALLLVFLLTMNDYSVPSAFSTNTYAMEIFAEYSVSMKAGDAFIASFPMLILGLYMAYLLIKHLKRQFIVSQTYREDRFIKSLSFLRYSITFPLIGILLLMTLVPLTLLIVHVDYSTFSFINDGGVDLVNTIGICGMAALIALPIMTMTALALYKSKNLDIALVLILLPALLSPSLIGAALINFWRMDAFRFIYLSPVMAIMAVIIRFMPIGIFIILVGLKKIPEEMVATAYLTASNTRQVYTRIILPLLYPSLLIASGIVCLLGIGELGATVMVLPPGLSTVTVRLFSYLHYGASEKIAELSLLITGTVFITTMIIYLLFSSHSNLKRRRGYDKS